MGTLNRIAAAVLAVILIALGLFLVVQTVAGLVATPWPVPTAWRDDLTRVTFADRRVLWVSIVVGVVGLLIVIVELMPRKAVRLPTGLGPGWFVRRRSVERRTVAAAQTGGGADHAHTEISGDPTRWRIRITGAVPGYKRPAVEEAVRSELATLGAPGEVTFVSALRGKRVE
jgi:hypothetical protein